MPIYSWHNLPFQLFSAYPYLSPYSLKLHVHTTSWTGQLFYGEKETAAMVPESRNASRYRLLLPNPQNSHPQTKIYYGHRYSTTALASWAGEKLSHYSSIPETTSDCSWPWIVSSKLWHLDRHVITPHLNHTFIYLDIGRRKKPYSYSCRKC